VIACQDVNMREIQDMKEDVTLIKIELYKVSHWFARTKHNIP
jgi:hypothetical protein